MHLKQFGKRIQEKIYGDRGKPDRIVGESIITDNRVLLDMDFIDPVTNRVVPDNLSKLFTRILN